MKCDFLQTRILSVFNLLKRVGFAVLLLGVSNWACGQTMDTLWTRVYPTVDGGGCAGVFSIGDSILLVGNHIGPTGHGFLLRWVSPAGQTLDTLLVEASVDTLSPSDAKLLSDETIILCGRVNSAIDTYFVSSVSVTGDVNWYTRRIPPGIVSTQGLEQLCITTNHEIVTIGTATAWDGQAYTSQYWVTWMDTLGAVIQSEAIRIGSLEFRIGESIVATRDGGVLVSGMGNYRACFAKFSSDHELEWVRFVGHPSLRHTVRSIVQDSTGDFYYVGYVNDWDLAGEDFDDEVIIGSLSERGDSLWMIVPHVHRDQMGTSLILSREGNLIIGGNHSIEGEGRDLLYASCTRGGNIREFRSLSTRYLGQFSDILQAQDSSFYFSGAAYVDFPFGFQRFLLAQVDRDNRIASGPSIPTLVSPAINDTVEPVVRFDWAESIDPEPFDTVSYELTIRRGNEVFTCLDIIYTSISIDLASSFAGDPTGSYSWSVEARSSYPDTSIVAGPQGFYVIATNLQDTRPNIPEEFDLSVFPNPFNSTLSISLDVPLYQEVTLSLYDLLGREVDVIYRGRLESGTISYAAPAALSSGVYFLRAVSAHDAVMQKVMLLK